MTLSDFHSRIEVDKSKTHIIISINFDLQEMLQEKYYIDNRSGVQKSGITEERYMYVIHLYSLI